MGQSEVPVSTNYSIFFFLPHILCPAQRAALLWQLFSRPVRSLVVPGNCYVMTHERLGFILTFLLVKSVLCFSTLASEFFKIFFNVCHESYLDPDSR